MKKCASCTKDLPDAALHCVFCGAKQPPAPAVQQGLAKTAFGYSANDVADHMRQQGRPMPPPPPAPAPSVFQPPPYQPPRAPAPPSPPVRTPPPAPMPPGPPPYAGPPPGLPPNPASAATLFAPSQPQLPPQPPTAMHGPSYGRPNLPVPPGPQGPTPAMLQPTLIPPSHSAQPQMLQPQPYQSPYQPQPQMPQVPMMRIPAAQPPPYPTSQPYAHGGRPIEPWRDDLRLMMFLWGAALLVAFATPLQTKPALAFTWELISAAPGKAKLPLLLPPAIGLLSVIVAGIPMPSAARGLLAAILGLAGVFVPILLVGVPPWRPLSMLIGTLLIIPGLVLRSEYRAALLPRVLVTLGAIGILASFLVPEGSAIPLVAIVKGVIEAPGAAKIAAALSLGLIVIVVMSLLAWLPAPATGGAKLWAWLLILWSLIIHVAGLLQSSNLGDAITTTPNATLVSWIVGAAASGVIALGAAYLVLVGYGLAAVAGKQLE